MRSSGTNAPLCPANAALNFWAVLQANLARKATQRQHFPRSAESEPHNIRGKPHRSPEPMAKSGLFSCKSAQKSRGGDRGQSRGDYRRKHKRGRNPQIRPDTIRFAPHLLPFGALMLPLAGVWPGR